MIRKLLLVIALSLIPLWAQQIGQPGNLLVSCAAVTSTGPCTAFAVNAPQAATYTWQTSETGSPASVTVNLEGSLDGSTWSTLDTTSSASGSFATVSGKPVRQIRCNLATLTGGTNPTVTCQMTISATSGGGGGTGTGTVTSITATAPLTGGTITTSGSIGLTTVPPANGGVASSSVASQDYYLLPMGMIGITNGANAGTTTSGTVRCGQFTLDRTVVFTRVSINVVTTSNTNHEYIAIYNAAGTSLLMQATFTLGAGTGVLTQTVTQVTLPPGIYWLARSTDNATSVLAGIPTVQAPGTNLLNGGSIPRYGTASTTQTGGVMPANLGTVTGSAFGQLPLVLLEP